MSKQLSTIIILLVLGITSCRESENEYLFSVDLIRPVNESDAQPLDVTLEWQSIADEVTERSYTYDVYLGTSPSSLTRVATDLRESTFDCQALALNSEYFWKIQTKGLGQVRDSPTHRFTTTSALPSFEFQNSRITVYPATFRHYTDSPTFLVTLRNAGAYSWDDGRDNIPALLDYYQRPPVEELGIAVWYCDTLNAYGFSDWYLPAIVELDSLVSRYQLLQSPRDAFWSSTEYPDRPHQIYTKSSLSYPGEPYSVENKMGDEYLDYQCRCIRRD